MNDLCNVRLYKTSKKYNDTLICRVCRKHVSGKTKYKDIKKHVLKHFRMKMRLRSDSRQHRVAPNDPVSKLPNNDRITSSDLETSEENSFCFSNHPKIGKIKTQESDIDETKYNAKYTSVFARSRSLINTENSRTSTNNLLSDTPDELDYIAIKERPSKIHDTTLLPICDICRITFANIVLLKEHVINDHKETELLFDRCKLCKHLAMDINSLPIFSTLSSLTQHVVERHQSNLGLYKCTICSMNFCNKIGIEVHSHYSHGEGQYGKSYSGMIM